jgi:hypothetical protein
LDIKEIRRINDLIANDQGYTSHKVDAKLLKIDYFHGEDKLYLETGVAYLEGKLDKNQIQSRIYGRLERLEQLWDGGLFTRELLIVEIIGVSNEDSICTHLEFSDGFHRTIHSLARRSENERYCNILEKTPIKILIEWQQNKIRIEDQLFNDMEKGFLK